ncbi:hypothetical protein [uncultured Sphingomonas sp.]|uniref:hypothetical protein n=1 Tax=uncultured Sphingomonas sp. TaxID=158754 RepID=UPI0035C9C164
MRNPLILAPFAVLAACAQTPAQTAASAQASAAAQFELDKELAGLVPGKPVTCIDPRWSRQVKSYGDTILYGDLGGTKYRSDTAGGCRRVGRGDVLVTRSFGGQLCRGDIARTIDPVSRFQTGSCSFAAFVPYRKPS